MGKAPVKKVLAVRKFTDRGEPREAFTRIFEDAQKHTDEFNVISFYGIGGFGKTRLINELARQLDDYNSNNKDLSKIAHVTYDFSRGTEKMFVFGKLKYLLKKQGLSFPYYDSLEAAYNIKCGNPVYKTVGETELIDNPMISVVAKFIPGASTILSSIKTGKTIMEESAKYYKKIEKLWNVDSKNLENEIKSIGRLEINELEDKASYYFAQDLIKNTESVSDEFRLPVVIFLDTYEELVNSYKSAGFSSAYDIWLREDIIKAVPGILWVIGGRERLRWEEEDDFWEGAIDEHELGDLSREDSFDFLRTAGIPEELLDDIYSVTGGTPLFLDLNVTTYYELVSAGKPVTRESFGASKQQVIERFLRYMNQEDQYIAKLLAVLENWNDAEAETIGKKILPVFYRENYNNFIEHTIIIKDNEQRYYMHQQVRKVILDAAIEADPEMVKDIYAEKVRYLANSDWQKMDVSERFSLTDKVISVFENAGFSEKEHNELGEICYPLFTSFLKEGLYTKTYEIFHRLSKTVEPGYAGYYSYNYNLALACYNCSHYRDAAGMNNEGLQAVRRAYMETRLWPDQKSALRFAGQCKSLEVQLIMGTGKLEKALEVARENYSRACTEFGEESKEAIRQLNSIGTVYDKMGSHEVALDTYRKVYEQACKAYGSENEYTMVSLNNIANDYYNLKDYVRAFETYSQVYTIRSRSLGTNDRSTLKSLNGMARSELASSKFAEAIELYEKLLADCEGIYEGNDYGFLEELVVAYKHVDKSKAIATAQKLADIYESYYGSSHYLTVSAVRRLNELETGEAAKESLKQLKGSIISTNDLFTAGEHYETLNDYEAAIKYYLQNYQILSASSALYKTQESEMLLTISKLGACYFWSEHFTEALRYYEEYYDYCLKHEGVTSQNTLLGLTNICQCLEFSGKYDRLLDELPKLLEAYNYDEKMFYRQKFVLAFAYLMKDRKDECYRELRDIYENREVVEEGSEKANEYEHMAMVRENPTLIFSQETIMLKEIIRFTEERDKALHEFYSEALEQRRKVIETLTK